MNKVNELNDKILTGCGKLLDGTTIKVERDGKTLLHVEGELIYGLLQVWKIIDDRDSLIHDQINEFNAMNDMIQNLEKLERVSKL